jgi:hypothetical protein
MIDRPQVVQSASRSTAVIHLTVPRAEIQQVMGPAISEVLAAVKAQGIGPAGPESSRDPANWKTELNRPLISVSTSARA